jgi:hypothetical protein
MFFERTGAADAASISFALIEFSILSIFEEY